MSIPDEQHRPWHTLEIDPCLAALGASREGLSDAEAQRRLDEHGLNELPSPARPGRLRRFLAQFQNVLIYVLLAAAAFTAVMREWVDVAVILAVVLINAVIGFIQEGKAERAMESIREMLSPTATVIRDGQEHEIPAEQLAPGDLVLLRAGDRVPADLRLIDARNAQIEEAALTGESQPVSKHTDPVEHDTPLGDRQGMAYSSTVVISGQLRGIVVATGADAEIGRISQMVSDVQQLTTPLLRKVDAFGRQLSVVIVAVSALTFALGYFWRGFTANEMFMAVVSLAVAAIPEGLPAVMTITLALGVQHMARRNAIVRRLPAVETLGSVTVACSDKTGTLTRNEMTVAKVVVADQVYAVEGAGYDPSGRFLLDDQEVDPSQHPCLFALVRAGLLASDARLINEAGAWALNGAPTEGALVVLARRAGLARDEAQQVRPRLDVIPFESERRYMATLHEHPDGHSTAYVKGGPERVLEMCTRQASEGDDQPLDREAWRRKEEELASAGHRVLALATKPLMDVDSLEEHRLEQLTLLGLVGIIDPPRPEAIEAIEACHQAGIRVKMITGDHALTARSIAASLGIGDGAHAITGGAIEHASEDELKALVADNDVFARFSPEHKLRLVEALQAQGEVVAMTGDGVNDAPALKRADVGVAMGIKGSEAAKQAAEMVLADDNFATIELAIEEGRTIYDNLKKTILFYLPTSGAQSLVVITAVVVAFEHMPITPLQILWVNMVTAVTLALALAFESAEAGIMSRPPRPPDQPILSRYLIWRIIFVSALIAAASISMFQYWRRAGAGLAEARTTAVNTLVVAQVFYLFNSRFIEESSLSFNKLIGSKATLIAVAVLIAIQLAFTYVAPVQSLFGVTGISATQWGLVLAAGLIVFFLVELEKLIVRKLGER